MRGNPNLPLNRGKESETNYQQQSQQIHGQRINLHESTNENKRVIARSNPRGENRTLTPPPQRVSSAQRERAKYEDNPHRIHHKPGSTVPNLKAGSERTNRAAKWLVEEQYKSQSQKQDLHNRLALVRDIERERRDRAKVEMRNRDVADLKRVLNGKEPHQSVKELPHFTSTGKKKAWGNCDSVHGDIDSVYHSIESGSGVLSKTKSLPSSRQPVPRLSHIQTHPTHQPEPVAQKEGSDDEGEEDVPQEKQPRDAILKLMRGSQHLDLPSPGVEIRLRAPIVSDDGDDDMGFGADDFKFPPKLKEVKAPSGDDEEGEGDNYGGDSDFETEEKKSLEEDDKPKQPNNDAVVLEEDDDNKSLGEMKSESVQKDLRKEKARKYLEEKKKKFALSLKQEKEKQKKLEEEKKMKLQALDASRKQALREPKKKSPDLKTKARAQEPLVNEDSGESASPPPPPVAPATIRSSTRYSDSFRESQRLVVAPALDARLNWALDVATNGDEALLPHRRIQSTAIPVPPPPPPYFDPYEGYESPDEEEVPQSSAYQNWIRQSQQSATRNSSQFHTGRNRNDNGFSQSHERNPRVSRSRSPAATRVTKQADSPPRKSREKLKPEVPKQSKKRRSKSAGAVRPEHYAGSQLISRPSTSKEPSGHDKKKAWSKSQQSSAPTNLHVNAIDLITQDMTPERPKKHHLHALARNILYPKDQSDNVKEDHHSRPVKLSPEEYRVVEKIAQNSLQVQKNYPGPGQVSSIAKGNDDAATRLLKSMDRLREEVAQYSENVNKIVTMSTRESVDELSFVRSSLQNRLTLAMESIDQYDDHHHRHQRLEEDDHHSERKSTDHTATDGDDDQSSDGNLSGQSFTAAADDDGDDNDDPWNTQLHPPINDSNHGEQDHDATRDSSDFYRNGSQSRQNTEPNPPLKRSNNPPPIYYEPGPHADSGDILLSHQMGLLRDKNEILKRFRGDSPDLDAQRGRMKGKGREELISLSEEERDDAEELVWGDSSYRIERIGGQDRLVKSSLNQSSDQSVSREESEAKSQPPPSLRNVGQLAGVLTINKPLERIPGTLDPRELSDYSDSESTGDPLNSSSDHRIISIFANEIYQQMQSDHRNQEEAKRRDLLVAEAVQRASRSSLRSPERGDFSDQERMSVNEELLTPRTYWDMMMAKSTLPSTRPLSPVALHRQRFSSPLSPPVEVLDLAPRVEVEEAEVVAEEESPVPPPPTDESRIIRSHSPPKKRFPWAQTDDTTSSEEHKKKLTGAELQMRLMQELYKQEQLFTMALDLSEAEQVNTVHVATHQMNALMQSTQTESLQRKYQSDMLQMQHAYEMSLATTAAEALLSTQMEIARRDAAYQQLAIESKRQQDEQSQLAYLTQTLQNVHHATELVHLQQSAGYVRETQATHGSHSQTTVTEGTMTDPLAQLSPAIATATSPVVTVTAPVKHQADLSSSNLNDSTTYSVSFEQESTHLPHANGQRTSQTSNDYDDYISDEEEEEEEDPSSLPEKRREQDEVSEVPDSSEESGNEYEMTFVEESIISATPTLSKGRKLQHSTGTIDESIVSESGRYQSQRFDQSLQEVEESGPPPHGSGSGSQTRRADRSQRSSRESVSADEYSEDYSVESDAFIDESHQTQSSAKKISFQTPALSAKKAVGPPTPAAVSTPASANATADLFTEFLKDLELRQKSLEKSITMRLQIEKKKLDHQLQILDSKQPSGKSKKSREYAEERGQIENDYHANVAELEKERWTMSAQVFQEKRKYEQLRRELAQSIESDGDSDSDSRPAVNSSSFKSKKSLPVVPLPKKSNANLVPTPTSVLESSYSRDESFESMSYGGISEDTRKQPLPYQTAAGATAAAGTTKKSIKFDESIYSEEEYSVMVPEEEEVEVEETEDYDMVEEEEEEDAIVEDQDSVDEKVVEQSFEVIDGSYSEDEVDESQAADEYSSEVFENLSMADVSLSKPPKPISGSAGTQPSRGPKAESVSRGPKNEPVSRRSKVDLMMDEVSVEDPSLPSKEELDQRSQALILKRQRAADLLRRRNEELERRKELIRIEEEERELEKILAETLNYDLEKELEAHRQVARIEAKKAAEAAAAELNLLKPKTKKQMPSLTPPAAAAPPPAASKAQSVKQPPPPRPPKSVPKTSQVDESVESEYSQESFAEVSLPETSHKRNELSQSEEIDEEQYSDDAVSVVDDEITSDDDLDSKQRLRTKGNAVHKAFIQSVGEEDEIGEVEVEEEASSSDSLVDEEEFEDYSVVEEDKSQEQEVVSPQKQLIGVSSLSSQFGLSYADDFEDEKSTAVLQKSSRVMSVDYLSDFEETEKELSQTDDGSSGGGSGSGSGGGSGGDGQSNSSDTLGELEKSLEQRSNRIEILKQKLEKMQTEKRLERLRAKQSERERLEKEESDLLHRIQSEEEMYQREKQLILHRGTVERASDEIPDEEDAAVDEYLSILKQPLEAEEEVVVEEDNFADDSWGSQPEDHSFDPTRLDLETTIAQRIRLIEAVRMIQALVRGFVARRKFVTFRKLEAAKAMERKQYEVPGDLIEEYEKTTGFEEIYAEDSFGSDEVPSDGDSSIRSESPNDLEGIMQVAHLEKAINSLNTLSDQRNQLSAQIPSDLPPKEAEEEPEEEEEGDEEADEEDGNEVEVVVSTPPGKLVIETGGMVFDEYNQRWISTSKSGEVDMSGFDDSDSDSDSQSPSDPNEVPVDSNQESIVVEKEPPQQSEGREVRSKEFEVPSPMAPSPDDRREEEQGEGADSEKGEQEEEKEEEKEEEEEEEEIISIGESIAEESADFNDYTEDNFESTASPTKPMPLLSPEKIIETPQQENAPHPPPAADDEGEESSSDIQEDIVVSPYQSDHDDSAFETYHDETFESTAAPIASSPSDQLQKLEQGDQRVEDEVPLTDDLNGLAAAAGSDLQEDIVIASSEPHPEDESGMSAYQDETFESTRELPDKSNDLLISKDSESDHISEIMDELEPADEEDEDVFEGSVSHPEATDLETTTDPNRLLQKRDTEEWFEESLEEVEEKDVDRTIDSLGVDVLEEVRSPIKSHTSPRGEESLQEKQPESPREKPQSSLELLDAANRVTDVLLQQLMSSLAADPQIANLLTPPPSLPQHTPSDEQHEEKDEQDEDDEHLSVAGEDELDEEIEVESHESRSRSSSSSDFDASDSPMQASVSEDKEVAQEAIALPEVKDEASVQEKKTEDVEEPEEDYASDSFVEDSEEDLTPVTVPPVSNSSLRDLPSLGVRKPVITETRDRVLDALLGEDEPEEELKPKGDPRFGKPKSPRDNDSFALPVPLSPSTAAAMLWSQRQQAFFNKILCHKQGTLIDIALENLNEPNFPTQNGLIPEDLFLELELEEENEQTSEEDPETKQSRQMYNKVIFDRVNELLVKLHHSRNTSKASLSLHQRMLAQNIPLERVALVDYLKQKLMSPPNKVVENPTVSLQINALENIREVIQSGLVESAESITNVILSRLLVDITQSLVKSLL